MAHRMMRFFLPVHQIIYMMEKLLHHGIGVRIIKCEACREGKGICICMVLVELLTPVSEVFQPFLRLLRIPVKSKHDKLVASVASDSGLSAKGVQQQSGQRHQRFIACQVSVMIVDLLEEVYVDQIDKKRMIAAVMGTLIF